MFKFSLRNLLFLHPFHSPLSTSLCSAHRSHRSVVPSKVLTHSNTKKMQIGRNSVRCAFKIVETFGWGIVNVQKEIESVPYKAGVGSLMYIMIVTRTNIAFAVSMVSQFILKVRPPHWMTIKHIMRYLKCILDFKSCLGHKDIILRGFCNANWVKDANN